jgi:hypothetical protein
MITPLQGSCSLSTLGTSLYGFEGASPFLCLLSCHTATLNAGFEWASLAKRIAVILKGGGYESGTGIV